jgi:hypothetical protein
MDSPRNVLQAAPTFWACLTEEFIKNGTAGAKINGFSAKRPSGAKSTME